MEPNRPTWTVGLPVAGGPRDGGTATRRYVRLLAQRLGAVDSALDIDSGGEDVRSRGNANQHHVPAGTSTTTGRGGPIGYSIGQDPYQPPGTDHGRQERQRPEHRKSQTQKGKGGCDVPQQPDMQQQPGSR